MDYLAFVVAVLAVIFTVLLIWQMSLSNNGKGNIFDGDFFE